MSNAYIKEVEAILASIGKTTADIEFVQDINDSTWENYAEYLREESSPEIGGAKIVGADFWLEREFSDWEEEDIWVIHRMPKRKNLMPSDSSQFLVEEGIANSMSVDFINSIIHALHCNGKTIGDIDSVESEHLERCDWDEATKWILNYTPRMSEYRPFHNIVVYGKDWQMKQEYSEDKGGMTWVMEK